MNYMTIQHLLGISLSEPIVITFNVLIQFYENKWFNLMLINLLERAVILMELKVRNFRVTPLMLCYKVYLMYRCYLMHRSEV